MIPRWMIDVYLLWLGCRWLFATPNFGDLLLNSATELKVKLIGASFAFQGDFGAELRVVTVMPV